MQDVCNDVTGRVMSDADTNMVDHFEQACNLQRDPEKQAERYLEECPDDDWMKYILKAVSLRVRVRPVFNRWIGLASDKALEMGIKS